MNLKSGLLFVLAFSLQPLAFAEEPLSSSLTLHPGADYTTASKSSFTIVGHKEPDGIDTLPSYLQGNYHREMTPHGYTFQVNFEKAGTFAAEVSKFAAAGATLEVTVDAASPGTTVAFLAAKEDTDTNYTLTVNVPAGAHTIKLLNPGLDWLVLGDLSFNPGAAAVKVPMPEGKAPTADMLPGKGPAQHGDWFDKVWTQRRADFSKHRDEDKGALIFLGDSITQGLGNPAQFYPEYKCANRGISGDTTRGILYRLKEDVIDENPEAVVLLIGTNDIGIGGDPADIADNLKAILAALHDSNPALPVIVCKVMPSDDTKQRPANKIQKLNALVDELVKGNPQFIRCDTYSIFADATGNAKKEEFPDLLHPNKAGQDKWAAAVKPLLAKLKLAAK